jgi:hypothetical protein
MSSNDIDYKQIKREIRKNKAAKRRGPLAAYRMAIASLFAAATTASDLWSSATAGEGVAKAGIRFAAAFAIAWIMVGVIDAALASAGRQADRDN